MKILDWKIVIIRRAHDATMISSKMFFIRQYILVNCKQVYQYYLRGNSDLTNRSQYEIPKGMMLSLKSYLVL